MKSDIHPTLNNVVFIDSSTGTEFVTTSTLTSEEKKKVNGVECYVIHVDISSASHPFYTGKQTLVDTAGRVDKFRARQKATESQKEKHIATLQKKESQKKETLGEKLTRKAKENTEALEELKEKASAKKADK